MLLEEVLIHRMILILMLMETFGWEREEMLMEMAVVMCLKMMEIAGAILVI